MENDRAFAYVENKYTFILIFMIQIAIDSPIFKRFKKIKHRVINFWSFYVLI